MHFCYIDESGDSQAILNATDNKQPMLVIAGLFIDASAISGLTKDFIDLKRRYYPSLFASVNHELDVLLVEIKGSDLRTDIRKSNSITSAIVQHHFHFLDDVFALCKKYDVKIVGRVWAKAFGQAINDESVYTITAQNIAKRFEKYLLAKDSRGAIIADFRDPTRNRYVAHSVFTQKHKQGNGGDAFPSIEETATFGVSNNHACLQITDLMCSAIIAPMAGRAILTGVISNAHTHANYEWIRDRYKKRLRAMQFHCKYGNTRYWGLTAHNPHGQITTIF
ncbi:TPA: DUF3800 domain-containing protein [Burkholderia vietnamiensis]|uniref:DUF3800 domain-containing protein n=1 Tax=Burkholderia TaxID=32008 RepID=UPI000755B899|nr:MULTISPECIES: DUF3800 domain-containing protein [Burkholderia]KWC93790.1 hypothetical protein WL57_03840 [Burkholderia cepacia]MBR7911125.1 DUF3800 domain-containing protein [Burkholderia vietnamiensis]RQM53852.1 DUF3800 domain-containing protein [Burkholderia vietnamiensis]HDR9275454.1 DUF3800 domain-containing protein [Burkholderia vietnamiensis]